MPRRRLTRSKPFQAPVGGWDRKNALADMPEQNAYVLDNFFPGTDRVRVREGYASHATGLGSSVESLMAYHAADGSGELFGAAGTSIFDVTASGAVGAAEVTGLTNARFQHTQITNTGGHFLMAVNGEDGFRQYNGTTWSTATITGSGLTPANVIWINNHQRRLWFGEKNSLRAWYLAIDAVSGTASSFDLGAHAKRGGEIIGMGTWTRDSGSGTDDAAVFLTSEGEAIVYTGYDPSDATIWTLVGVYQVGEPIGRRCMIKFGGDLIMITELGFVPASQALLTDSSQTGLIAVSDQINDAVNESVMAYRTQFGWQPFIYPAGLQLMFNIPISSTEAHQYVFNTITRAPCRFTGMPAICWELLESEPYFGSSDGTVYKYGGVTSDAGSDIEADVVQAFSYFGSPTTEKAFKRVEPIFQSAQDPEPAIEVNTDFDITLPSAVSVGSASGSARWGISKWGIGLWGSENAIWKGWRSVRGHGRAASIRIRINTKDSRPSWLSTVWQYLPGGNT